MSGQAAQIERHACCKRLFGHGHTFAGSRCSKRATVKLDGKWYCTIHDPVRVKAKRAERDAEQDEKFAERVKDSRIRGAAYAMLAALQAIEISIVEHNKDRAHLRDQINACDWDFGDGCGGSLDVVRAAIAKALGAEHSVRDASSAPQLSHCGSPKATGAQS